MSITRSIVVAAIMAASPFAASLANGAEQKYPVKPIRIIVPFSAGSQTDILARMIGQKMFENWGQQVVVDNRPGAGGRLASETVLNANPDGYNLLMQSASHAVNATLYANLPYDTIRDFAGVTQVASVPNVLVVAPSLNIKSVKDLIALAKAKPGTINFGSAGIGSGTHINGEQFKLAAAIDVMHIPYKGTPEALTDTATGRIHYFFSPLVPALPFIRDKRLVPLAVSTAKRSPVLPDVPTVAEAALPGFEFDLWYGLLAPRKAPRPVLEQLSKEVARILALPDVKERMLRDGAVPKPSTPQQFDAFIKTEVDKLGKVVRASGTKAY
ncbi:MAG: tripartite tricarboxylate transporter substrate binding protein [Burkholderiales bacterium]